MISIEARDKIIELYNAGWNTNQIPGMLLEAGFQPKGKCWPTSTVKHVLNRAGISTSRIKSPEAVRKEIVQLYARGLTESQIRVEIEKMFGERVTPLFVARAIISGLETLMYALNLRKKDLVIE